MDKTIEELMTELVTKYDVINILNRYNDAHIIFKGKPILGIASIIKVIKSLPPAQSEQLVQSWIPVSERLPKNGEKCYWICTDTGYQCECRWTKLNHFWTELTTDWHWHIGDIPQYSHVVAWRELPESYEEKKG